MVHPKTPGLPQRKPKSALYLPGAKTAIKEKCTCNQYTCKAEDYDTHYHQDPQDEAAIWYANPPTKASPGLDESGVHEPLALAQALVVHIESTADQGKRTRGQRQAIKLFRERLSEIDSQKPTEAQMIEAKSLLSEIFFRNSLQTVDLHLNYQHDHDRNLWLYGENYMSSPVTYRTNFSIELYEEDMYSDKGPKRHKAKTRFLTCCAVLLHEMCHAFLHLYSCTVAGGWAADSRRACCSMMCGLYRDENIGASSPGRGWHYIIKPPEKTVPKVLGVNLKLWHEKDFIAALENGWTPSKCDLEHCFTATARSRVEELLVKEVKKPRAGSDLGPEYEEPPEDKEADNADGNNTAEEPHEQSEDDEGDPMDTSEGTDGEADVENSDEQSDDDEGDPMDTS